MRKVFKSYLQYLVVLIIIFTIVIVDQVTKITSAGKVFSLIGDFIWIQSTNNTGAAFSFGAGSSVSMWIFITSSFVVSFILLFILFTNKVSTDIFFRTTLSILIGGIIGNLIDRLAFGYVRDFIYLKFINFAIFNVADMALTISCIMLVIWVLFLYHPKKNKNVNSSTNEGK